MGISIERAIENNIISKEILSKLPTKCKCGAPLEFSDSLRELRCANKNCTSQIINRIKRFNSRLNLELSDSDIEELLKLHVVTPYQLIMIGKAIKDDKDKVKEIKLHNKELFMQKIEKVIQNEYLLYEIIELCGIESIENIAYKLFRGFENTDDAYNEIESGQVAFINERLGIKNQDSSIISYEIYSKLIDIKEELIFAESQFKIRKYAKTKLNIAINDNIIPFLNIGELIDWLNYNYNYEFNLVTTISDTTDILIRNSDSSTAKFRIARLINDKHIAEMMNNGEIEFNNIGKFNDNDIKPLGSKVYIDTLENIIKRLDKFGRVNV